MPEGAAEGLRVLKVPKSSFGTLQKTVAGSQGSQERAANAGGRWWKLQGRFWRCYPSVSEPYKKL